jgi:hypothetical protein
MAKFRATMMWLPGRQQFSLLQPFEAVDWDAAAIRARELYEQEPPSFLRQPDVILLMREPSFESREVPYG